jgi:hypothetical protein
MYKRCPEETNLNPESQVDRANLFSLNHPNVRVPALHPSELAAELPAVTRTNNHTEYPGR